MTGARREVAPLLQPQFQPIVSMLQLFATERVSCCSEAPTLREEKSRPHKLTVTFASDDVHFAEAQNWVVWLQIPVRVPTDLYGKGESAGVVPGSSSPSARLHNR
jgi:hypothetical protein